MLDVPDAIIVTLGAVGEKIINRTAIQKLIYFEYVLKLVDAYYRPHYYGPYSSEVAGTIQELVALGFVEEKLETKETTGYYTVSDEWKRYCYTLTNDGLGFLEAVKKEDPENYQKIFKIVKTCGKPKLNSRILSWAAKVHYIASNEEKEIAFRDIISNAKQFKWDLTEDNILVAVDLLKELGLVRTP